VVFVRVNVLDDLVQWGRDVVVVDAVLVEMVHVQGLVPVCVDDHVLVQVIEQLGDEWVLVQGKDVAAVPHEADVFGEPVGL